MKIVVDINHPANVHYFKNFIWEMEKRGHELLITASNKDLSFKLLNLYGFRYQALGSYGKGIFKKILMVPVLDFLMYRSIKKFEPDLLLGHGSLRVAHTGFLLSIPSLVTADTEGATLMQVMYRPFVSHVLTPRYFKKDFGNKQIRFNGTTDLLYLHPNRFKPDPQVLAELDLTPEDTFFIVRFVSFDANHDIGVTGIRNKVSFIQHLEKYGRVLITSEGALPSELKHLQISISPEKIHDVMAYATLFVGESGTMATESATLGVHAVVVNPEAIKDGTEYTFGVFEHLHQYGLLDAYNDERDALCRVDELLSDIAKLKEDSYAKRKMLLDKSDDVTEWLIEIVEKTYL